VKNTSHLWLVTGSGRVSAVTAPVEAGCSADRPALVGGLAGFLSNYRPSRSPTTADAALSSPPPPCPWRIVVGRGQRINLTLVDFGTPPAADGCVQYATVTERHVAGPPRSRHAGPPTSINVCGGNRRRRHIQTTSSNAVDIQVTSGRHDVDTYYFLLQYKGQLIRSIDERDV